MVQKAMLVYVYEICSIFFSFLSLSFYCVLFQSFFTQNSKWWHFTKESLQSLSISTISGLYDVLLLNRSLLVVSLSGSIDERFAFSYLLRK
jgi:hypothetical protein